MTKPFSAGRRATVFRWHQAHAATITATCAHFGIARSTFYRWRREEQARSMERQVRLVLGDRPRRRTRPTRGRPQEYWTPLNKRLVADLEMRHPRWGRRRVWIDLATRGFPMSEATVGRLLRAVRGSCPICGPGAHHEMLHALYQDLFHVRYGSG